MRGFSDDGRLNTFTIGCWLYAFRGILLQCCAHSLVLKLMQEKLQLFFKLWGKRPFAMFSVSICVQYTRTFAIYMRFYCSWNRMQNIWVYRSHRNSSEMFFAYSIIFGEVILDQNFFCFGRKFAKISSTLCRLAYSLAIYDNTLLAYSRNSPKELRIRWNKLALWAKPDDLKGTEFLKNRMGDSTQALEEHLQILFFNYLF